MWIDPARPSRRDAVTIRRGSRFGELKKCGKKVTTIDIDVSRARLNLDEIELTYVLARRGALPNWTLAPMRLAAKNGPPTKGIGDTISITCYSRSDERIMARHSVARSAQDRLVTRVRSLINRVSLNGREVHVRNQQ